MLDSNTSTWYTASAPAIDTAAQQAAERRQQQLTKPQGSLGLLEQLAIRFAGFQGCERPRLEQINIVVFAADHGVCARGVSAFPQTVTAQMVANFAAGGAAINVLSRCADATLQVVNVGTVEPLPALAGVLDRRVAAGTNDFSTTEAMTPAQVEQALAVGAEQVTKNKQWQSQPRLGTSKNSDFFARARSRRVSVDNSLWLARRASEASNHRPDDCMDAEGRATLDAKAENRSLRGVNEDSRTELTPLSRKKCIFRGAQLSIGGEMGIGNTTSAAAIYSAILDLPPEQTVGPGTGVDAGGLKKKRQVVEQALNLHRQHLHNPLRLLSCLGGFEIAALTGFYIASAQNGIPVLLDGFISTAAGLLAKAINPSVQPWLICSHVSAEPAHQLAIQHLGGQPVLNIGMRLGEGSGAALVVPLLRSALALHNEMATFADAGVADG